MVNRSGAGAGRMFFFFGDIIVNSGCKYLRAVLGNKPFEQTTTESDLWYLY